jgi:hypothetical protein
VSACDLLVKLVEQFHELYGYFNTFSKEDFERLGVVEVRRIGELELLFDSGLRETADLVSEGKIRSFSSDEVQQIIEAKFERTTLRDSIIKSITRQLD